MTDQGSSAPGGRRIVANLTRLLTGKAAAGLMSLVYLVLVARTLGARDYGVLTLVHGYAQFVGGVVAFSGFHGVVRYGALAIESGDTARLARIVRFMTLVELACGAVAVLVALALVPIVGPRLGWSPAVRHIALIYSIAVLATVRATPQGLLQLAGRFDRIALQQLASPIVRLIGSLIAWAAGGGLDAFLAVWLISCLAEGGSMWLLAWPSWRALASGERLRGPWRGETAGGFGRFILVANADLTLRDLAPNLAPLTVGWVMGPAAAGLYSLAQRATAVLQQPAILVSQASYSVLVQQATRGRLDLLRTTVWRSAAIALAAGVVFTLALALAGHGLLPLVGGKSFRGGAMLTVLVAAGRALSLAATPLSSGITALGRPQGSALATLVSGLILYPLLPVLLLWVGIDGAGWHALAQGLVLAGWLAIAFRRDARDGKAAADR